MYYEKRSATFTTFFATLSQHCSLGFFFSFFSTNHNTPVLVVLFLSFLLNIYMCMYSNTNLIILTIFSQLLIICIVHWPLFFHNTLVLVVLSNIMCIHNYIDATNFYNIFIIIEVSIF